MKKLVWIIISIIIILVISLWFICKQHKSVIDSKEFTEKIDSLESKVDSIYIENEVIREQIDTVYIKLEDNQKQYEENVNDILDNDVSEDYIFFREYINSNKSRLDSLDNCL